MSNKRKARHLAPVGGAKGAPPHPAGTTEWNRFHIVAVEAPTGPNRMGTILGVWRTENGDDALRLAERLWEWAGDRNRDEVIMVTDQLAREVVWQRQTNVQLEVDLTVEKVPHPACDDPACGCRRGEEPSGSVLLERPVHDVPLPAGRIGLDEGLAAARAVERGEAPSGSVILKVTGPASLADPAPAP